MPDDTPAGKPPEGTDAVPPEEWEDSTVIAPKVTVVFHDDPQTPVDFVLFCLEKYFGFDEPAARELVGCLRAKGRVEVVSLAAPVAELALRRVADAAAQSGYPFRATSN